MVYTSTRERCTPQPLWQLGDAQVRKSDAMLRRHAGRAELHGSGVASALGRGGLEAVAGGPASHAIDQGKVLERVIHRWMWRYWEFWEHAHTGGTRKVSFWATRPPEPPSIVVSGSKTLHFLAVNPSSGRLTETVCPASRIGTGETISRASS